MDTDSPYSSGWDEQQEPVRKTLLPAADFQHLRLPKSVGGSGWTGGRVRCAPSLETGEETDI